MATLKGKAAGYNGFNGQSVGPTTRYSVNWVRAVRPFATAAIAGALGISLSVTAWFFVAEWEERLAKQDFLGNAEDHAQSLQAGLDQYLLMIGGLRSFFEASNDGVTRKEFNVFTKDFLRDRKAILSFSWIPNVKQEDRADHELAGRNGGLPDYEIKSVGPDGRLSRALDQAQYFPVFYSNEPPGSRGYGINLQDGHVRQRPLDRARESNGPATSGNFRLQSGPGDRTGFFVVLPVYRIDHPHETADERRRNLMGFVQGVFQFHVMIDTILADAKSPLNILLYDINDVANELPIYVRASEPERTRLTSRSRAHISNVSWTGILTAGDRNWELTILPSAESASRTGHDRAWIILIAGLMITGLVSAYFRASINHVLRLQTANASAFELARTDALTELANRRAFVERLTVAFSDSTLTGDCFALHFIDLDEFKDVNDVHGHATGDLLLKEVATRLSGLVGVADLVARFGGDEFAVLQTGIAAASDASTLARTIIDVLDEPYKIDRVDLRVTASVGIALFASQADGPTAMMMQADLALYRAKRDGRSGFSFHSGELSQEAHLRVTLADELRTAIERGELECHYQPQVEIRSGRIIGLEALVRWNHPQRGMIMPSIFIPVAEKSAIIERLGHWVFEAACAQMAQWEVDGIAPQILAVNVSGLQINSTNDFVGDIADIAGRLKVKPSSIELEVTETVLMEAQKHGNALSRIREMGFHIAIDDFGTGYSSLKYLTLYPVNKLKIAQDLVIRVTDDPRNATVVKAAIRLANDLGLQVIAEGVETDAQARFLLSVGCKFAQGYLYCRPINAAAASRMLRRGVVGSADPVDGPFKIAG